jgi:hypothetical protein
MLIFISVLATLSLFVSVLALSCAGRILLTQQENSDVMAAAHNATIDRLGSVADMTEHALDCLVSIDSRATLKRGGA